MQPQQKQYTDYVASVLKALDSDPTSLNKDELRLATRHRKEMWNLNRLQKDIGQLHDQMHQAEARLRSLELQAADTQGKVSGFMEYLISLKFPEVDALNDSAVSLPELSNKE